MDSESSPPAPNANTPSMIPVEMVASPPPPRRSSAGRWIALVVLLLLLGTGALLVAGVSQVVAAAGSDSSNIQERFHSLERTASDKIVILNVEGTILDGDAFKKQIDKVRGDKQVKAVVLRVDSPGGTVTASDYIFHHLKKLRAERELPMVVSMGSLAASGGYYVSMAVGDQEKCIFAEPSTWSGSIGVMIPLYNFSGLMERLDVADDTIASHELKGMGSPTRPLTPEERAVFQELVDESFARFKEVVQHGRPRFRTDTETLDKVATGQVFTTKQAIEYGLVDMEGFLEDAIDRALEMAGLDRKRTRVVQYVKPKTLMDVLLSSQAHSEADELKQLLGVLAPRAWYLFTR